MADHTIIKDPMIDTRDGQMTLSVCFSTALGIPEQLQQFAECIVNDDDASREEVALIVHIPIEKILDQTFDFKQRLDRDDAVVLSQQDKPEMDALREKLLSLVSQIDQVKYIP